MMDGIKRNTRGASEFSTAYTYDGMSRLAATTFNNGASDVMTVGRGYDSLGRLTGISSSAGGRTHSFAYTYNPLDKRTKCVLADGSCWVYSYDAKGQIASAAKFAPDGRPLPGQRFGYAYDDIGNLKVEKRNESFLEYTSNSANAYTSRTVPGAVDISGSAAPDSKVSIQRGAAIERVPLLNGYFSKTYVFNNTANAINETFKVSALKFDAAQNKDILATQTINVFIPKTPEQFTYDADGNMLSDGRFTYTWDAENRLIKMEQANRTRVEHKYDHGGRRAETKSYTWDGASNSWALDGTEKYAYDAWNCVAIFDGANVMKKSFVWGEDLSGTIQGAGGVGGLLAETNSNGTFLPAYDGNGNIIAYINAVDGKTAAEYEYNPFGKIICKSGPMSDAFTHRFSTKYHDKETGLYYYGYRHYNPETARWISRDPLGEFDTRNRLNPLYAMTGNDPINKWDYLGLEIIASENNISVGIATNAYDAELKEVANNNCHLTIKMRVNFRFQDTNLEWKDEEKRPFIIQWTRAIKEAWANKHHMKCLDKNACCNCKNGVRVGFDFVATSSKLGLGSHWNIDMKKVEKHEVSGVYAKSGRAEEDSMDLIPAEKEGATQGELQRGAVHEFGHMLGVDDEYYRRGYNTPKPAANRDTFSMMNIGEYVRQRHYEYFLDWVNEKVKDKNPNCKFGF